MQVSTSRWMIDLVRSGHIQSFREKQPAKASKMKMRWRGLSTGFTLTEEAIATKGNPVLPI